jgi:hypothetical protein
MKLQGASILDLVTELLIRLDAMGKVELVNQPLAVILEGCGHEPVEAFTRMLGEERVAGLMAPKAARPRKE